MLLDGLHLNGAMHVYAHLFNLVNLNYKYSLYSQGLVQVLDKPHDFTQHVVLVNQASPASTNLVCCPRKLAVPGQCESLRPREERAHQKKWGLLLTFCVLGT